MPGRAECLEYLPCCDDDDDDVLPFLRLHEEDELDRLVHDFCREVFRGVVGGVVMLPWVLSVATELSPLLAAPELNASKEVVMARNIISVVHLCSSFVGQSTR